MVIEASRRYAQAAGQRLQLDGFYPTLDQQALSGRYPVCGIGSTASHRREGNISSVMVRPSNSALRAPS